MTGVIIGVLVLAAVALGLIFISRRKRLQTKGKPNNDIYPMW